MKRPPLPIVAKLGDIECVSWVEQQKRDLEDAGVGGRIEKADVDAMKNTALGRLLPTSNQPDWAKDPK